MDPDSPTLWARMRRSLGYRGPRRTLQVGLALARYRLRRGWRAPRPHAFDLEFGTETVSLSRAHTYRGDARQSKHHEPIDTVDFADLLAQLEIDWRGTPRGRATRPASRSTGLGAHGPSPVGVAPRCWPGAWKAPLALSTPAEFRGLFAPALPTVPTARPPRIDFSAFTFLDIGSGQGRALMLASDYPFARIVGIEHGLELYACAQRNLARYRSPAQRCHVIENLYADALAWELPFEPTVFYVSEPFEEPMLRRMVQRVLSSLRKAPRPAWVIYDGNMPGVWEETGAFEAVAPHPWRRVYRVRT